LNEEISVDLVQVPTAAAESNIMHA